MWVVLPPGCFVFTGAVPKNLTQYHHRFWHSCHHVWFGTSWNCVCEQDLMGLLWFTNELLGVKGQRLYQKDFKSYQKLWKGNMLTRLSDTSLYSPCSQLLLLQHNAIANSFFHYSSFVRHGLLPMTSLLLMILLLHFAAAAREGLNQHRT